MANAMLTHSMIAREALFLLSETLITSQLVYRDYTQEWADGLKKGDTVTIRKPATFVADEFDGDITTQNITEGSTQLTLEKHFDVSFEVTSKERTLELDEFSYRVLRPAVLAISQAVNRYTLQQVLKIPYHNGAGFPTTIGELATALAVLDDNLVPMDGRFGSLGAVSKAKLLGIPEFTNANKRGDGGQALRMSELGELLGLDWYMDQMVLKHTAGTLEAGAPEVNGAVAEGATVMDVDGGAGTETVKAGDLFTVTGAPGQYVVTEDATAVGGAITGMKFYPAAPVGGFGNDAAIEFVGSHEANLAGHPNAIALAVVPLAIPQGAANAFYMADRGIGIRYVSDYDISKKKEIISLDVLAGADAIQKELAMRLLRELA